MALQETMKLFMLTAAVETNPMDDVPLKYVYKKNKVACVHRVFVCTDSILFVRIVC